MKGVHQQTDKIFKLGVGKGNDTSVYVIVGFLPIERLNEQKLHNDSFWRPPIISTHFVFGT